MAMSPAQSGINRPNNESPPKVNNDPADDDSGLSVSSSHSSCSSGSDGETPQQRATSRKRELSLIRQNLERDVKAETESLASFIVATTLGSSNVRTHNEVEATLLRCTNAMVSKHEILFGSMMRRLQINDETAYNAFINVVNQLFEAENTENSRNTMSITWNRIIALYTFGSQLALHCKKNNLKECERRIPIFLGRYAKEVLSDFLIKEGGWKKLCEEYPAEDDIDNKVWKLLTWTALGLGIATAASFLASNH